MKGASLPDPRTLNGENCRIGIACALWNKAVVDSLLEGCIKSLNDCGVTLDRITVKYVPGSFELPFAARRMMDDNVDAVICIGVLIKGETMHFEYIADAVSKGIMNVQLEMGVPTIFGVLTCLNEKQARARAGLEAGSHNHGSDWGIAAVQMINF